ncbi:MAG: outer membrane lipid asymmetry maintenance protein MlaD [Halothiobacillaceae bacterium]
MKTHHSAEVWVGLFVALGLGALFVLAMQMSNFGAGAGNTYQIEARFDNVGGLTERSPVKLAGLTIGRVGRIDVDTETFEAVVTLQIDRAYDNLPRDTFASIYTAGLLGEQYIELSPGAEDAVLEEGDRLAMTQSAVILERLVSQFLFDKAAE